MTDNAKQVADFAGACLRDHILQGAYGGGVDCETVENAALAAGLFESVRVTEACGENCNCMYLDNVFPSDCIRLTALGREVCYG